MLERVTRRDNSLAVHSATAHPVGQQHSRSGLPSGRDDPRLSVLYPTFMMELRGFE